MTDVQGKLIGEMNVVADRIFGLRSRISENDRRIKAEMNMKEKHEVELKGQERRLTDLRNEFIKEEA